MFKLKVFFIIVFLVSANFSLFSQKPAQTSQLKIGVVDTKTIIESMPETLEAEKSLKELDKKYSDSLVAMQNDYMSKLEKYQKTRAMMPPEQQQKEEEAIGMLQNTILKFREDKFRELAAKRDELLDPIRKIIKLAIKQVANDEGFTFVLDKGSETVLYSEDKFDITFRVLDKIKRGGSK